VKKQQHQHRTKVSRFDMGLLKILEAATAMTRTWREEQISTLMVNDACHKISLWTLLLELKIRLDLYFLFPPLLSL
jgi:hypothetical protein